MSNFDSAKNGSKKNENPSKTKNISADKSPLKSNTKSDAKMRWSFIQSDLDNAASEWNTPTAPVKTPDEEQLEKVKNIIEDLKEKLNEF